MVYNDTFRTATELTGVARGAADAVEAADALTPFLPSVESVTLDFDLDADVLALPRAASFRSFDATAPYGKEKSIGSRKGSLPASSIKLRLGEYQQLRLRGASDDAIGAAIERKADEATEQEKALEAARQQGENIGAERYLRDAVIGRFQALTGRTDEEVATTFAHVDPKSFTDDKGDIVADKLKAFADTFGSKNGGKPVDHVAAALAAQRAAAGGAGSSIAEKRKQTRESMTKKTA